jgi:hypothetical protein
MVFLLFMVCCSTSESPKIQIQDYPVPSKARSFYFERSSHPRLVQLREREGLDRVVDGAKTELEQFVLLRDWTKRQWKHSIPNPYPPWDALVILDWIRSGKTGGFCAQYAVVFLQACLSLGYQGRYIDINKEGGTGHFVTEVWSNQYAKWIVMDPDYNIHYERQGIPLSALELHNAWESKRWEEIRVVLGPHKGGDQDVYKNKYHLIDYYHHFSVDWRNDHLSRPVPFWNRKGGYLSWKDPCTEGRTDVHERFVSTPEELYWPLNSVDIVVEETKDPNLLQVALDSVTPAFDSYWAKSDWAKSEGNGGWAPAGSIFTWNLRPGRNRLEVRAKNRMGILGPISHVEVQR